MRFTFPQFFLFIQTHKTTVYMKNMQKMSKNAHNYTRISLTATKMADSLVVQQTTAT